MMGKKGSRFLSVSLIVTSKVSFDKNDYPVLIP